MFVKQLVNDSLVNASLSLEGGLPIQISGWVGGIGRALLAGGDLAIDAMPIGCNIGCVHVLANTLLYKSHKGRYIRLSSIFLDITKDTRGQATCLCEMHTYLYDRFQCDT